MEAISATAGSLRELIEPQATTTATAVMGTVLLLIVAYFAIWPATEKGPPMLRETIPFFSTTYQFATSMTAFLGRLQRSLETSNIVGFYLVGSRAYVVTGVQNIQTFFRNSPSIGFERFFLYAIINVVGATPDDVAKFAGDKSGRLAAPLPGTENTPHHQRSWRSMHTIMHKYLSQTQYTNGLAVIYNRFFTEELDAHFPRGEWVETGMYSMLKTHMTKAAILSFQGRRIFEVSPDIIDLFWEYDKVATTIMFGPPKWLLPKAWATAGRFRDAMSKYLNDAYGSFDWDGPEAEADWDPIFGARFTREFAKWMKQSEFSDQTRSGLAGLIGIMGTNGNTIPLTTWHLMHIISDPDLLSALRSEISTALVASPTGVRTFNIQALTSLPLLQSVYTEVLRLHVSVSITREVVKPLEVEGYVLPAGSMIQAPMALAHRNAKVWTVEGHPAEEFWAKRHIKMVGGKKVFQCAGRQTDFYPYGGGIAICPGRHFAKQEILLTVAILLSRFEFEFVEWVTMDGKKSDRPPRNNSKWEGAGGLPPDVDMKVRMKRVW